MRPLAVAYRDWPRTLLALRMLVAGAFLILVAFAAIAEFVPEGLRARNLTGQALDLADDAIWAMLLTPVVIAIHHFVIQGIVTSDYTLPLGDPVYRKVFVWLFALKVLSGLPFDLLGAMQMLGWPLWAGRARTLRRARRGNRPVAAADDLASRTCRAGARRDSLACARR